MGRSRGGRERFSYGHLKGKWAAGVASQRQGKNGMQNKGRGIRVGDSEGNGEKGNLKSVINLG